MRVGDEYALVSSTPSWLGTVSMSAGEIFLGLTQGCVFVFWRLI